MCPDCLDNRLSKFEYDLDGLDTNPKKRAIYSLTSKFNAGDANIPMENQYQYNAHHCHLKSSSFPSLELSIGDFLSYDSTP